MNRCEDDEFGGVSLHLTRLSCEERQFSWQVRTAIELEESLVSRKEEKEREMDNEMDHSLSESSYSNCD